MSQYKKNRTENKLKFTCRVEISLCSNICWPVSRCQRFLCLHSSCLIRFITPREASGLSTFLAFITDFTAQFRIFHRSARFYLYTPTWERAPRKHLKNNMSGDWISVTLISSKSNLEKLRQIKRLHESHVPAVISLQFCQVLPPCCHFIATLHSVLMSRSLI